MSSPENSSLWLVPPSDSALNKTISKLINETLPPLFPEALPPQFVPHLTLTASTIPTPSAPEDWLLQLQLLLPDLSNLAIEVGELHVGDIYFQKLIQLCDKTPELCQLATKCRVFGTGDHIVETKKWVEGNYKPHVSLVYSDLSPEEMTSKLDRIKDEICKAKEAAVLTDLGILPGEPHHSRSIANAVVNLGDDCKTASGGEIWFVPTFKDVGDWQPIARRAVDESVKWRWET